MKDLSCVLFSEDVSAPSTPERHQNVFDRWPIILPLIEHPNRSIVRKRAARDNEWKKYRTSLMIYNEQQPSVGLPVRLSIYPSVRPSVYLSCILLSIRLSVHLFVCMSVCLPFCLSIYPSVRSSVRSSPCRCLSVCLAF